MFSLLKRKFSGIVAVLLAAAMVFVLGGCVPLFDVFSNDGSSDGAEFADERTSGDDADADADADADEPSDNEGDTPDNETPVDPLADTSWLNTSDSSYMVFSGEDTYYWYQEKSVQDDNYYTGSYTCRKGQDAVDYLVNEASLLGLTESELERTLSAYPEVDRENFISIGVYETSFMKDGEEQNDEPEWKYYLGFMVGGAHGQEMELLNLQTTNYMSFVQD